MCRFFSSLLLICALLIPSGCATFKSRNKKKPSAPAPQPALFRGTVTLVNENAHFVLIDGGYSGAPADSTVLKSYSAEVESGVLKVSPERRRPFVIADIVSGSPKVGDQVVESRSAAASVTAPATPATP